MDPPPPSSPTRSARISEGLLPGYNQIHNKRVCPLRPSQHFFVCSNYEASVRIADLCAKIVSACSPSSKDQVCAKYVCCARRFQMEQLYGFKCFSFDDVRWRRLSQPPRLTCTCCKSCWRSLRSSRNQCCLIIRACHAGVPVCSLWSRASMTHTNFTQHKQK
jgi:hypothetical protein